MRPAQKRQLVSAHAADLHPAFAGDWRVFALCRRAYDARTLAGRSGMDGDFVFSERVDLRPALQIAPVLFVGVGCGASFGSPVNKRGRDYTPFAHGDEPGSSPSTLRPCQSHSRSH